MRDNVSYRESNLLTRSHSPWNSTDLFFTRPIRDNAQGKKGACNTYRLPFGIINCGDSMTNDNSPYRLRQREKDADRGLTRRDLFLWYDSMSLRHPENRICIDYL